MKKLVFMVLMLIGGAAQAATLSAEKDMLQKQIFAQLSGSTAPAIIQTETVKVPALKTNMDAGDIISESDIVYVDLAENKVDRGYIVDAKELIGKTPARTIFAKRAIMSRQITAQTLVEEKKAVTLFFKNNAIEMQDMGVAMEDGALGDFIRVRNVSSNIIVSGKVVAENLVEVAPQGAILAKN